MERAQVEAVDASQTESTSSTRRQRKSKLGVSINNLLDGEALTATELVAREAAKEAVVEIDPACEEKVALAKDRIVEHLMKNRPRISVAFRDFEVEGNVIKLVVPSRELHDEIMHDKAELQRLIAQLSGAKGLIEIEVAINEQIKVARPITLEDRIKHLVSRNDRLSDMIERLQLDSE